MNYDVPSPTGGGASLSAVKTRVLNLLIDEVPDRSYRLAVDAHDVLVRASDAALTHARRLVARLRAAVSR